MCLNYIIRQLTIKVISIISFHCFADDRKLYVGLCVCILQIHLHSDFLKELFNQHLNSLHLSD